MASLPMIQEDKRAEFIAIEGGGNRMGVWSELNSDYTAQLILWFKKRHLNPNKHF
jgi:hypothetical protein